MALIIDHEIEIDAAAETVWEVITDVGTYPEWNPFVKVCQTSLKPGEAINMQVKLGNSMQKANEIIDEVHTGRGFSYRMKPLPMGALRSYRTHDIEPKGVQSCVYRSHFELSGWLSPLVIKIMGAKMQAGFDGMAAGIKTRSESLAKQRKAA